MVLTIGLTQQQIDAITTLLASYSEVKEVKLFGSRAKGTFKNNSDIDLAIMNEVSSQELIDLSTAFADSDIPFKVDIIGYHFHIPEELKEHIDRVGKPFWKRLSQ